jgi:hypothetical protein
MRKWIAATVVLLLFVVPFFVIPGLRFPKGQSRDLEGVIESIGVVEGSGATLHGKAVAVASVRLQSGQVVQVGTFDPNTPIGSHVIVREQPQTVGAPKYGLVIAPSKGRP